MPYYNGAILEVLIKAGYAEDERVLKALEWLLGMRQNDGGWIILLHVFNIKEFYKVYNQAPIPPERERFFFAHGERHGDARLRCSPALPRAAGGGESRLAAQGKVLQGRRVHLTAGGRLLAQTAIPVLVDEPADRDGQPGAHEFPFGR